MKRLVLAVTVMSLAAVVSPAHAYDAGVVSGSGVYAPGLDTIPMPQAFSFSGSATTYGTNGLPATFACAWSGVGLADNVASGAGTFSGSCGPLQFTACTYVRSGAALSFACQNGANGSLTITFPTNHTYTATGPIVVP
jgi:hypothetical protein